MSEWKQFLWGDIATLEYGQALRGYQEATGPVRVFGTNGPVGWTSESQSDGPGVIIGRKGAYRGVHYSEGPFWVIDTAYYLKPKCELDLRWAYYALKNQDINSMDSGSAIPSTSRADFYALSVKLPPLSRQRAIAAVLGALDDKIAANERIAATADELIRARYIHIGQNFTDVIKIGELGEQRREIVAVGEFDTNDNYIGLEHVPRRHVWLKSWADASGVESSKGRFKEGDILFGKLRPYFHKVGIALVAGVASTDIIVIRPRQEAARGWLLAAASSDEVVDHASAVGDGTRMPRVKWQDIASFEVPWPGNVAAAEFNEFVAVLTERVRASIFENLKLMELRDSLLPGLMSGTIRVREAEKMVEAAT